LDVELNQELHGLHLLLLSLGELLAALDVLGREGGEEPGCHAGASSRRNALVSDHSADLAAP
jgi:hypothetical protein